MKKLVFLLAVAFSAALYSCGNKAEEATPTEPAADPAVEVVEEAAAAVDTVAGDTVVAAEEVVEAAPAE